MTKNKSFRKTPIPHRSKFGEPMVYYVLSEDGKEYTRITRSECLGSGNLFVDDEAGIVIRLPDNEMGEKYARMNMRSNWREQKQRERRFQCIWKETKNCNQKCEACNLHTPRTVELDKPPNYGSVAYEPADSTNVEDIVENKVLLDLLYSALSTLTQEEQKLIVDIFWRDKTERELAPTLGLKEPKSVNKRKHRILEKLSKNEDLKNYLK